VSGFLAASFLEELAELDLLDVNVRVGPSASHGHLALEADALLAEMDRFHIRQALVSHWTSEEYDAAAGNRALARDLRPRLLPAWSALPDEASLDELARLAPRAVRLTPGKKQHNYSLSPWCSDALLDYLEQYSVVTLVSMQETGWEEVAGVLDHFPCLQLVLLDLGYRADRYLFPLLDQHPGLHFDSATYLAHRQLEAYIEQHGADRVLFGSRLPLFTPGAALGVLASARVAHADKLAVAGGNLRRLLAAARPSSPEVQA